MPELLPDLPIRPLTREERACSMPDCPWVREVDSLKCARHREPRPQLERELAALRAEVGRLGGLVLFWRTGCKAKQAHISEVEAKVGGLRTMLSKGVESVQEVEQAGPAAEPYDNLYGSLLAWGEAARALLAKPEGGAVANGREKATGVAKGGDA